MPVVRRFFFMSLLRNKLDDRTNFVQFDKNFVILKVICFPVWGSNLPENCAGSTRKLWSITHQTLVLVRQFFVVTDRNSKIESILAKLTVVVILWGLFLFPNVDLEKAWTLNTLSEQALYRHHEILMAVRQNFDCFLVKRLENRAKFN